MILFVATEPNVKKFYRHLDGKIVSDNIISQKTVSDLSECMRLCSWSVLCQAFSLADDMTCAVAYSVSLASVMDGPGTLYYNIIRAID